MKRVSVTAAAAAVGALSIALHLGPSVATTRLFDRAIDGGAGFPVWLPTLATTGETVIVYTDATDVLAGLGLLAPGLAFGYYVGTRRAVDAEFRGFARAVVVGTTVGVAAAGLVGALTVGGSSIGAFAPSVSTLSLLALGLLRAFVEGALVVVLATLAGAAVAAFGTDAGPSTGTVAPRSPADRSVRDD